MIRKILILLFVTFFFVAMGIDNLSIAVAEPVGQSDLATATPSVGVPETSQENDPQAQFSEDVWQLPYNLSGSGATSAPQIVTDSNGISHILWLDEVEGFGYAFGNGEQWSTPVRSEFPFFTRRYFPDLLDEQPTPLYRPVLAADGQGQIYAFWIGAEGVLFYSSVPSAGFTDYLAWTPRRILANRASTIATSTTPDGRLQLIYIRDLENNTNPAGIYYRQADSSGTWTDPTLLYASRYLRSVDADVANIHVFAPDSNNVYAVWDDTLKEQIYFASSSNGGLNWGAPQKIDRRETTDDVTAFGPANIALDLNNEQLHLTWSAGHEPQQECTQYVSTSTDSGATWTSREALVSLPRCFASAQFVVAADTLFLLGTTKHEGTGGAEPILTSYLLAWDGSRWSEPQIQEALTSFSNPETNQAVHLACHFGFGQGTKMRLIGCDTASAGDTWFLSQEAGDIEEWFPPPPVWQGPEEINSGDSQPAETRLLKDSNGTIHAFWTEDDSPQIYRASWDGDGWSTGQKIMTSPKGAVTSVSTASAGDRLFLAWEDSQRGVQFSKASTSSPSQWTDPVSLVESQPGAGAPSIVADAGGNVFLAFAVQLNEERGVYLIHSADAGETWSSPIEIFNGAEAGWNMIDKPLLARTENGQIHLMWMRKSLPPDSVPLELAYSRSENLGQTWSETQKVVEAQSSWSELIGTDERFVHRLWSEENGESQVIWHSYSLDGGLTWSPSIQVTGIDKGVALSATVDPANRPHLLTLQNGQLKDLVWDDLQWSESDKLETTLVKDGSLDAVTNQNGQLLVAYASDLAADNAAQADNHLFAMWRMLDLPAELPTPLPTLTPTRPAQTPMPTMTPEPTPTVFFSTQQEQSGLGDIPGMGNLPISLDLIVSLIPVIIIVGLGILIGIRLIRKR